MKLTLDDKSKIDILVAFFQLIKNCSSVIKMEFYESYVFMQGMDKSHVCLFNNRISADWFTSYQNDKPSTATVDTSSLHLILSRTQENNTLVLLYADTDTDTSMNDKMEIQLLCNSSIKGEYSRYFELPTLDVEQDSFAIPEMEYDADFSLKTKQLADLTSQLILFGDILEIVCDENTIELKSTGDMGTMKVSIPIEDLNEFSITEGENLELTYSLVYIHKMCLHTKLAKDVQISISKDYPIRVRYDLDGYGHIEFYVAPKMAV